MPNEQFCTDSHRQWALNEDKWRALTPSHEMSGESATKAPAPSIGPGLSLSTPPSPEFFQPHARQAFAMDQMSGRPSRAKGINSHQDCHPMPSMRGTAKATYR